MDLEDIELDLLAGTASDVRMTTGFPTIESSKVIEFGDDDDAFGSSSGSKKARQREKKAQQKLKKKKSGGFQSLNLSPAVYRGVMRLGYSVPTPIQRQALPIALTGQDIVAMARTGSGKTAAFLIPVLERLKGHNASRVGARAVVLSPTRELATQTMKFAVKMAKFTDLRLCLLTGGGTMNSQFSALAKNPDLIIATPGRLMHLLVEIDDFHLNRVECLVFDEADRLFEMGFAEQIKEIMAGMPTTRQSLLFSATMPRQLMEFARAGLKDPEVVRLDVESTVSDRLQLAFFTVRTGEKLAMLLWLLQDLLPKSQQAIVFTCTRHHVEFVHNFLRQAGVSSAPIYGQLDQAARAINLAKFRGRKCRTLIVTDVAARGIDIPYLDNVINFDFPDKPKLFVHRVGRVARQGRRGASFSLVTPKEVAYMVDACLFVSRKLSNDHRNEDNKAAGYTLEEMTPELVHYGKADPTTLQPYLEASSSLLDKSFELQALQKTSTNAYQQYCKTRGEATRRSVARAKALPNNRVHPLMLASGGSAELNSYLEVLNSFRPPQTILEVDASKKVMAAAQVPMALKRLEHDKLIAAHADKATVSTEAYADAGAGGGAAPMKATRSTAAPRVARKRMSKAERMRLKRLKAGLSMGNAAASAGVSAHQVASTKASRRAFRREQEKAQFISSQQPDALKEQALMIRQRNKALGAAARLEESVMDLTPDETRDFLASKRIMRWDKRKKKYIKTTLAELTGSKRKRYKTADGSVLGADGKSIGRLYEQWKKKSKRAVGAAEDDVDVGAGNDVSAWDAELTGKGGGGGGTSELQSAAKLRKERAKAARLAATKARKRLANSKKAHKQGVDKKHRRATSKIRRAQAPTRSKAIIRRRK